MPLPSSALLKAAIPPEQIFLSTATLREYISSDATLNHALVFLAVMLHPGSTVNELAKYCDLTARTTSKILVKLSAYSAPGRPGCDLFDSVRDTDDGRVRHIYLSAKGVYVAGKLHHR